MRNTWGLLGRQNIGAPPAWDPSSVAAKHVFWLRGDSGISSGVSWTDRTNGNVFLGTVTADSSGINGQSRAKFASSTGLLCNIARASAATKGQLIIVAKNTSAAACLYQGLGANNNEYCPYSDGAVYEIFGTTTRYNTGSGVGPSTGSGFVYQVKADASGNWSHRLNGADLQSLTGNTFSMLGQGGGTQISIGGSGFFAVPYDGEIEELLVMDDLLTSPEQTSMAGYILSRYGLTL